MTTMAIAAWANLRFQFDSLSGAGAGRGGGGGDLCCVVVPELDGLFEPVACGIGPPKHMRS